MTTRYTLDDLYDMFENDPEPIAQTSIFTLAAEIQELIEATTLSDTDGYPRDMDGNIDYDLIAIQVRAITADIE